MVDTMNLAAIQRIALLFLSSVLTCVAFGIVPIGSVCAEEHDSSVRAVSAFLRENVIGRTVETRTTSKVNNELHTEFQRRVMHMNLVETSSSISFDQVALIQQTLWDLDDKGAAKPETKRVVSRVYVSRHEVQPAKSTGELTGVVIPLTSSFLPIQGRFTACRIRLTDEKTLTLFTTTPLYGDAFAAEGKFKPSVISVTTTLRVVDNKLRTTSHELNFGVNPETLERLEKTHELIMEGSEISSLF